MANVSAQSRSLEFVSQQLETALATGIGTNTFKLVENQNGRDRVEFAEPLPNIKPPAKKIVRSADRAEQKSLYKARMVLVLRDSLVAALANSPQDGLVRRDCVKGIVKYAPDLDAFNWKMSPNFEGLKPAAAMDLKDTYLRVARSALRGLNEQLAVDEFGKTALTVKELALFKRIENSLLDSIAELTNEVRPGQLPPPPGGYAKETPPTPLPGNAQQTPVPARPGTAPPTWLSSRPVTAQAQPTWFPPPQATAQAQPTGLPPPPGNHFLNTLGIPSPQISSQPLPQQMPLSSQPLPQSQPQKTSPSSQTQAQQIPPQMRQEVEQKPRYTLQAHQPELPPHLNPEIKKPLHDFQPSEIPVLRAPPLTPLQRLARSLADNEMDQGILRSKDPQTNETKRQLSEMQKVHAKLQAQHAALVKSSSTPSVNTAPVGERAQLPRNGGWNAGHPDQDSE